MSCDECAVRRENAFKLKERLFKKYPQYKEFSEILQHITAREYEDTNWDIKLGRND